MALLDPKPSPFRRGASQLSAGDLNQILRNQQRELRGSRDVQVVSFGDRSVISVDLFNTPAPNIDRYIARFVVLEELEDYLRCAPYSSSGDGLQLLPEYFGYQRASFATVTDGGTDYVEGDILTVEDGESIAAAQFIVTTISSDDLGTVTGVILQATGEYTTLPTNSVSTTGGAGTGCTLYVKWSQLGKDSKVQFYVAKPYLLQQTPWDHQVVTYPDGTYRYYEYTGIGVRNSSIVVPVLDDNGNYVKDDYGDYVFESEEDPVEEKITPPYFSLDILTTVYQSSGYYEDYTNQAISWMDLGINREWEGPGGGASTSCPWTLPYTTINLDDIVSETVDLSDYDCAIVYRLNASVDATIQQIIPRPPIPDAGQSQPVIVLVNVSSCTITLEHGYSSIYGMLLPGTFSVILQGSVFLGYDRETQRWRCLSMDSGGPTGEETVLTSLSWDSSSCALAKSTGVRSVINGRSQQIRSFS